MRYQRKVLRIQATDSPNVILALEEIRRGRQPSGTEVTPGVLTWEQYQEHLASWDEIRQTIGLLAEFYRGKEVLLFPPQWLDRAHDLHRGRRGKQRQAVAIGIDPAEGGDRTAMAAVGKDGLLELVSRQTPDTSVVTGEALAFMRKHNVPAGMVMFDRGGGGKQHADRLRAQGHPVRTVAFGEAPASEPRRPGRIMPFAERVDEKEERYAYVNRRAEMYYELSELLDPAGGEIFSLPDVAEGKIYGELRRQLAALPRQPDPEGRWCLPPKNRRGSGQGGGRTLVEMLGCSPDESDACVIACHALLHPTARSQAGAVI